jgi:hypothetical protein
MFKFLRSRFSVTNIEQLSYEIYLKEAGSQNAENLQQRPPKHVSVIIDQQIVISGLSTSRILLVLLNKVDVMFDFAERCLRAKPAGLEYTRLGR